MADSHPIPPGGEPEIAAWSLVADALEQALDTPGLRAHDRGLLVDLHDAATTYLGEPVLRSPVTDAPPPWARTELGSRMSRLGSLVDELLEINAQMRANNARFLEKLRAEQPAAGALDDGIEQLRISVAIHGALRRAGLLRVADVDRFDRPGRTVLEIPAIGPKRATELLAALERYHRERTA